MVIRDLRNVPVLTQTNPVHRFVYISLTLRLLMSYTYMEHPFLMFLDYTHDAAQSVGLLWTSDQLVAETST